MRNTQIEPMFSAVTPDSRHSEVGSASPFSADCVAKLFAALQTRNYRIRLHGVLNRCCALAYELELILRALTLKIVLQHNLP